MAGGEWVGDGNRLPTLAPLDGRELALVRFRLPSRWEEGTGVGCLAPYMSLGNVHCNGNLCAAGGLNEGDNPQDDEWEQSLETITFDATMESFSMPFMLTPNRAASRTHLSWEGTRTGMSCQ